MMDRSGYVYLLKSPTTHYKIGRTKRPDDRLYTFNVKLPFEVQYEHLVQCTDMVRAESILHRRFRHKSVNGEWFSLTDAEVFFVKRMGCQTHIEALDGPAFLDYWEDALNSEVRRENRCPNCKVNFTFSFPLPSSPTVWVDRHGDTREHVGFFCPSCKFIHSGSRVAVER